MANGTNSPGEQTALSVLTGFLTSESIIANLASCVIWAVGTWVGKPLLDRIPDFAVLFARAGRLANHDLLRALRRAECQAVVTLCDLTLRDEFGVSREALKDRLFSWFTNRYHSTPEFRALCHIRRAFSNAYDALEKMPVARLIELHGAAVSDVDALVAAGTECLAASTRDQLREQVVSRQLALLEEQARAILAQAGVRDAELRSLALATGNILPSALRQRIEQHRQGWWELLPLAFREELKTNPRARDAWQIDVLSQLQHQWGDSYEAFERKLSALDTTLAGMWDDLKSFRREMDVAFPRMLDALDDIAATTRRTEAKVNTLLLGKVHHGQPPPFTFPQPALAGTFFGRAALVTDLVARLERGGRVGVWGLAGMGKTALAAEAIRRVVGTERVQLASNPYPDGVVLLDLYKLKFTSPDPAWHELADAFDKSLPTDRPDLPARERARKACRGRQALVVVEGAEETGDGASLQKLLEVLAPETTQLILTRMKEQVGPNRIDLEAALQDDEALALLCSLCPNVTDPALLAAVHQRLGGHPLALTWAGSQLGKSEEPARDFVAALQAEQLPALHHPDYETHTLRWLYERTVKWLTPEARRVLAAAGWLAYQPLPLSMALAVLARRDDASSVSDESTARDALKLLVRRGLLRLGTAEEAPWEFTHALTHQFSRTIAEPDLLPVLGDWAKAYFTHASTSGGDFTQLGVALNHATTLLHADHDANALTALQSHLLYDGIERIDALGRLDFARAASEAVHAWLQRALKRQPDDAGMQRELSVSHNKVGDVLVAQGQLGEALRAYTASRTIREQLATQDSANAQWQRDLAVSYFKLGVTARSNNELATAMDYFMQARAISARLVERDPTNAVWKNDLAWVNQRIDALKSE